MYKEQINLINYIIHNYIRTEFKDIDDIKPDNLSFFLIPVFKAYENGNINYITFTNISEVLKVYFIEKYGEDYPNSNYPEFNDSDPRSIGIAAIEYMNDVGVYFMFPEDIPQFINFLNTSPGNEEEAHKIINKYTEKFVYSERLEEARNRGYIGSS